ncbi:MAG: DsrE family protein [Gammaproteobacteria bacterium]|nr:DsrE family protein [Gammaproteobacteria bacterium]MCW9031696.1 DsrE family protein [Gammaproteobacteria bacterium]
MRLFYIFLIFIHSLFVSAEQATYVETPYKEPKVMFEFYFDEPDKINSALYWLRSYINPLTEAPYNYAPEFMDIKVIIHGTEIVTLAKSNYKKYKETVERMKYYSQLGVEFRVCALAASDFGYKTSDFQGFVKVVPSAIIELGHWQQEGYAIIKPEILEKKFSIEELR